MSTSRSVIINKFHSCFKSRTEIPKGLEEELMDSAFGEYEIEYNIEINYNNETEMIMNDLKRSDVLLIAKFMYRQYWSQQLSRFAEMKGLNTAEMAATGIADSKNMAVKMYAMATNEIENLLHNKRNNTYYE